MAIGVLCERDITVWNQIHIAKRFPSTLLKILQSSTDGSGALCEWVLQTGPCVGQLVSHQLLSSD